MEILSNCATTISLSANGSPCIAIKARTSDTLGTYAKTFLVNLCDDELHNLHDWIEDYFETMNKEL